MASAFAAGCGENQKPTNGTHLRVVFGRDSRPSGPGCGTRRAAGLTASGVEVIDLDVVTTPGVAMMVKHLQADAGVIATASHNPIMWNGLKF
jgi:phosphoglucosamine mutase